MNPTTIYRHHPDRDEIAIGIVAVSRPTRKGKTRAQLRAAARSCRRTGGHFWHQQGWRTWWCCGCPARRSFAPRLLCQDCRGCATCLGNPDRASQ